MRVRVCFTVDVDNFYRRAIRHHYGQDGLASNSEVREWLISAASSMDDDIIWDLQRAECGEGGEE